MTSYFRCGQAGEADTFVIRLDDVALISTARAIISGTEKTKVHVSGTVIKAAEAYNYPFHFHLDSSSIKFFEMAIEVCDATAAFVEANLADIGGATLPNAWWCPWGSKVAAELVRPDNIMPLEIIDWMRTRMWGEHHLRWHISRDWDVLPDEERKQAIAKGWSRSDPQEGVAGNGLEFLAMHRLMIGQLRAAFPKRVDLFRGWDTPPIDAADPDDPTPTPQPTFDADKRSAIDVLHNHPGQFSSDDELGLFIETGLRPLPGDPSHRSDDERTGIHNYLHNRFSDDLSPITMGDPAVNIENQTFWGLHGWIDARWTAFRKVKGLSDTEPGYVKALQKAEHDMGHHLELMRLAPAGILKTRTVEERRRLRAVLFQQ